MLLRKFSQTFKLSLALMFSVLSTGLTPLYVASAANPTEECGVGYTPIAKYKPASQSPTLVEAYVVEDTEDLPATMTVMGTAVSGEFEVTSDHIVTKVVVAGGSNIDSTQTVISLDGKSGSFNNSGLPDAGDSDEPPAISHVTFCGQASVSTDVCSNIGGDQATVPEGMVKDVNGDCVVETNPCEANYFPAQQMWEITWGHQFSDEGSLPTFTMDSNGGLTSLNGGPVPAYMTDAADWYWLYVTVENVRNGRTVTYGFADGTVRTAVVSADENDCPSVVWTETEPTPQYYLATSHNTTVCGQVTISLRNVSPWIYPVSYSTNGSTPDANGPSYGPVVDNRGDAPDDQTMTKTLTFDEDENGGLVTVKYVIAAGTESDLYRNLPVGQVTTVQVDTDCEEPTENVDACRNVPGVQSQTDLDQYAPYVFQRGNGNCAITICHRTNAVENPYNKITVSLRAVDGQGKNDHSRHTGPIFDPATMTNGDDWGDIIPPNFYDTEGDNWTAQGQAVYANGDCEVPTDEEPQPVADIDATIICALNGALVTLTNSGDADGTATVNGAPYTVEANDSRQVSVPFDLGTPFIVDVTVTVGNTTVLTENLNCTPGRGGETPTTPTTPTTPGQVLGSNTGGQVLGASTELPDTLPATGGEANPFLIIIASLIAYGAAYFLQGRRLFGRNNAFSA